MKNTTTGLQIKLRRVAARLKQWDVAVKVGISPAKLSLIENERREASPELAERILVAIQEMAAAQVSEVERDVPD